VVALHNGDGVSSLGKLRFQTGRGGAKKSHSTKSSRNFSRDRGGGNLEISVDDRPEWAVKKERMGVR